MRGWFGDYLAGREVPGRGLMSKQSGSDQPGAEDGSRDTAKRIADEVAPLIKLARSRRFDFLAYLLGMALKESRRLSGQ
jgi:hypothetical protein